ncbi:MAG: DUF6504 family protein [Candidatus Nanopelagicales bacterium]
MRTYGETIEVRTAEPAESDATGSTVPTGTAAEGSSYEPAVASSSSAPSVTPAPPAQFLWRGRLYLVREVLAHWVELGTWWTARAPRTSVPADPHAPAPGSGGTAYDPFGSSDGPPAVARSVAADVGAVEREVWRVEAASGRSARIGVYDLVRDVPAAHPPAHPSGGPSDRPVPERWRLARALD